MGSQIGIVVAAVLLIGGPELVRELEEFRMLAFGGLMVLIMIWRPRGLLSFREPTVRLHGRSGPGGGPTGGSGASGSTPGGRTAPVADPAR
jgi:branched-chain amino acid transport system permease protein